MSATRKTRKHSLFIFAGMVAGTWTFAIACQNTGTEPRAGAPATSAFQAVQPTNESRYTPAEFHARNPVDWVGRAHNQMLDAIIAEVRKPNVRFRDICGFMDGWIANPANLAEHASKMPANWRNMMRDMNRQSRWCERPSLYRRVAAASLLQTQYDTTAWDLSDTADALIEAMYDAVEAIADPTQLASELSPILDASFDLPSYDSAMVQSALAVTQSSAEYWYNNNYQQMALVAEEASEELFEACAQGNAENEYYTEFGLSYQCVDQEWRAVAWRGNRQEGVFSLASNVPTLPMAFSCPSKAALYAGIAFADAVGGVFGAVRGWKFGTIGILIAGTYRGLQFSAGGAWSALGVDLFCQIFDE